MMNRIKDLRYKIMLALYLPILLYAFSTYDLEDESFVVQSLEPVVMGQETVVLGQPFNARAFLTVGDQEGQSLAGSGSLQAIDQNTFRMETADLLASDESEATVPYSGTFEFRQVDGQRVEIPVEGQFNVRRPEIVAVSEATQALYRQVRNDLRIDVPGLEDRDLRLRVGESVQDSRSISISPSGAQSEVDVYLLADDDEVYLGSRQFSVIDPPRPELRVRQAGNEVSSGDVIPRAQALLEFDVEADEEFRRTYPDDANYRAGRATVYLNRGRAATQEIGTFDLDGNRLILTRLLRDTEAGDRVTVRLHNIVRINHAGQAISVPLNEASRTFTFSLS